MPIDSPLMPDIETMIPSDPGVQVEVIGVDPVTIDLEDGGVEINFGDEIMGEEDIPFDANLAEYCDEECLNHVSSDLLSLFNADKNSRKDWEDTYVKGIDQLGMKIEDRTTPWPGACGVSHPILSEAVVRFQSQTITEIFPNAGPVKTKILGKITEDKEKQALRVREYMNYLITESMTEYRSETEKMLFNLALAGSAFRKVYWDESLGRPCSMFVPAEDLMVSYGAPTLDMADRITHVMKKTKNEVQKLKVSGFYRDIEIDDPVLDESRIQEKYDELTGDSPSYDTDGRHTLYEMSMDLDLTGFEDTIDNEPTGIALPYIITIDHRSGSILSIRRNWLEDDELKIKRTHYIHYEYLPGPGFYGFGLVHLIGGIAKSATSLLRQLVDAGTLSNLPGGLKSRGLRIKGDDSPIMPGEFRDVDVPGGAIRDNITFLPYKEPSNVLYQLLQNIVEEGRRFASLTDMKISDMNQQAPVGTTLAIIERSMKVMNAIQARIHYSMKKEFKLLSGIIRDYMPEDYEWKLGSEDKNLKAEDFDDHVDVIPVSDPNSSTMAQRIMQYQAALQLASTAPDIYDLSLLHRQMLDVLGIEDAENIVPTENDVKALDPVSENMNMMNSNPAKAYIWQDHESHIQVHMAAAQDPKLLEIISRSPRAKAIEAALAAHVVEHLGFRYRGDIEKELGVPLPAPNDPLPNDVEVQLSSLVAQAADMLLNRDVAEQQLKEQMKKMKDPIVQHQMKELELKQSEADSKKKIDAARIAADMKKAEMKDALERDRMISDEYTKGLGYGLEASGRLLDEKGRMSKEFLEGLKIASKSVEKIKQLKDSENGTESE